MTSLGYLQKRNITKMSKFHAKMDSNYLAPPSSDIQDVYDNFETPIMDANIDLDQLILQHPRQRLPHQFGQRIAYIGLCSEEWKHLESARHIQHSNIDFLMQQGFPNLYQHIHLHQQATDAINFKITFSLFLGANDKIVHQ